MGLESSAVDCQSLTSNTKDYLLEYDQAPEETKYPLVKRWIEEEPLPFFKQLRKERPILVTPECTLVSRFVDVRDMLQMPKIFTVDLYKPKMGVTEKDEGYLMAHDDDALHYREKSLMQAMLNREDLPRVRKLVSETAASILKQNPSNTIELINEYCRMVPATLVQEYFGLDGVDKKDLIRWSYWNQYDAFYNQAFHLRDNFQEVVDEHNKVSEELVSYMAKLVARKLVYVKAEQTKNIVLMAWYAVKGLVDHLRGNEKPSDDDITMRMLRTSYAKEFDFPLVRLGTNAGGLLIGAIETTNQAVSQTLEFLLARPELLKKAKQAMRSKEEFDAIVWECLRYVPISPYVFRQTSQEYTLAKGTDYETTIPERTNVLALTQSAMFDEFTFDNPDDFQPDRNWYHHFVFGFGPHECLGKYIGMEMIPEMVRQVLLMPNVQAQGKIDYKDGPLPEAFHVNWS